MDEVSEISDEEVAELYAAVKRHEQSPLLGVDLRQVVYDALSLRLLAYSLREIRMATLDDLSQIHGINALHGLDRAIPSLCLRIEHRLEDLDDCSIRIGRLLKKMAEALRK